MFCVWHEGVINKQASWPQTHTSVWRFQVRTYWTRCWKVWVVQLWELLLQLVIPEGLDDDAITEVQPLRYNLNFQSAVVLHVNSRQPLLNNTVRSTKSYAKLLMVTKIWEIWEICLNSQCHVCWSNVLSGSPFSTNMVSWDHIFFSLWFNSPSMT